jgi:uncharacterized protein YhfF
VTTKVARYWDQFLENLPEGSDPSPRYAGDFCFGSEPEQAPELAELVIQGTKTATGSLLWALEADRKPKPRTGDHWIVTRGGDDPACVIRTLEAKVIPFDEVGEGYAFRGGEGDRTLVSWRALYWDYIAWECARIGCEPHEKAPLVMETFQVVYSESLRE